jgi:hypothetical protein
MMCFDPTASILEALRRLTWFLAFVYAPLAILCAVATYHAGLVESYLWLRLNGGGMAYKAQRQIADNLICLNQDVEVYKDKHGKFPDRLVAGDLPLFRERGESPQFDAQGRPLDPWGRPYIYAVENEKFDIRTLGRDGIVGGRGLDADLSVERRYAPEPSLKEFLEHRAEMADRSETTLITWVCAALSVAVFALALWSRLSLPDRQPMTRWLLKVVATSVVLGISGGPVLFVLMMVMVLVTAFFSIFLAMAWLMITYWFGFEVPPMSFH